MRIWDRKSGFYRVLRREDFSPWFGYTHGHVVAQFQERPWNINNTNYTLLPNFSKHYKKMKKYNCFIMLHPHNHQGTTRPVPSALYEGLAHVAGAFVEIAEMILREKIPACFPYSIGEFKIDTKDKSKCSDMSKIVYYNPKTA